MMIIIIIIISIIRDSGFSSSLLDPSLRDPSPVKSAGLFSSGLTYVIWNIKIIHPYPVETRLGSTNLGLFYLLCHTVALILWALCELLSSRTFSHLAGWAYVFFLWQLRTHVESSRTSVCPHESVHRVQLDKRWNLRRSFVMCSRREPASVTQVFVVFFFLIPCVHIALSSFVFRYNLLDVACLILCSS